MSIRRAVLVPAAALLAAALSTACHGRGGCPCRDACGEYHGTPTPYGAYSRTYVGPYTTYRGEGGVTITGYGP